MTHSKKKKKKKKKKRERKKERMAGKFWKKRQFSMAFYTSVLSKLEKCQKTKGKIMTKCVS